jgi:hypothetical protein
MTRRWRYGDGPRFAHRLWLAFVALACLAASDLASAGNPASPTQMRAARETASRFEGLAGSPRNAWSLVQGLRWGTPIVLTSAAPSPQRLSFTPATPPMGYGNVARALAVARQELAFRGVAKPTPEQLHVVLMGGLLRTGTGRSARIVRTPGVLPLRSVHMGWGQIAHALAISPAIRPAAVERPTARASIRL